jgi:hypothetical protein
VVVEAWLTLLFFASLIVVGRIEHRRHERERVRLPQA